MNEQPALIKFFVEGEPRPKQSFRATGQGRGYTPARVKAWQTDVACEAEQSMRSIGRFNEPFDVDLLAMELAFVLGNCRRVDPDNLSKAVLDGLNGICYGDDRQIVDLRLRKRIAQKDEETGVDVIVRAWNDGKKGSL